MLNRLQSTQTVFIRLAMLLLASNKSQTDTT